MAYIQKGSPFMKKQKGGGTTKTCLPKSKIDNLSDEKKKELYAKMYVVAEPWIPYRTIACRYLWRAKDLD